MFPSLFWTVRSWISPLQTICDKVEKSICISVHSLNSFQAGCNTKKTDRNKNTAQCMCIAYSPFTYSPFHASELPVLWSYASTMLRKGWLEEVGCSHGICKKELISWTSHSFSFVLRSIPNLCVFTPSTSMHAVINWPSCFVHSMENSDSSNCNLASTVRLDRVVFTSLQCTKNTTFTELNVGEMREHQAVTNVWLTWLEATWWCQSHNSSFVAENNKTWIGDNCWNSEGGPLWNAVMATTAIYTKSSPTTTHVHLRTGKECT